RCRTSPGHSGDSGRSRRRVTIRMSAMDVRRTAVPVRSRRTTAIVVAIAAIAGVAVFVILTLGRTNGAAIRVQRASIVADVAQRGTLSLSVAAAGVLAPENVRIVDAVQPGVVQTLLVKPGAVVRAGDTIARMQDPDADAALVDARSALQVARAQ